MRPTASLEDERLNVVLFTLDTTRADHIGCYGHDGIETPAIDRLAAEGTRYDNAFTVVPITLPSHLSMMTGTYPSYHGVRENGGFYVPEEMNTLAEVLQGEGYETAAFVGAFPLDSQTGMDQGFDLYDDNYSGRNDDRHPRMRRFFDERPAAEVARAANAWLSERGTRPFFFWAHFFDAHQPLTPPSPHRERYRNAPYDAEIASVDEAIGRIVHQLEERELLDNTLVILTADHGEGLGEHGELTHALLLYSSTLRVPLIVRDPDGQKGATVTAPVATLDIFSTVLDRLGITVPAENQGLVLPTSDAQADPEREIVSETLFGRMIYGWSPMYRVTAGSRVHLYGPSQRLYDRSTDTAELKDLSGSQPDQLHAIHERLQERLDQWADGGYGFSTGAVSNETLARLAALGYVGATQPTDGVSDEVDPARADPLDMMHVFDLHNEGQSLSEAGRNEIAVPLLERAQELDPENPAVVMALAHARLNAGEFDAASQDLDRLLEISPGHVATHVLLSHYHRRRGDFGEAARLLEQAVELDPADFSTRLLLAHLLEDAGRLKASEASYRELLDHDPANVPAANGLATLLYRRGEELGATELLRGALDQQPYYAPAYLNLAVIEHDRGQHQEARRLAERALALRPSYPQALELLQMIEAKTP